MSYTYVYVCMYVYMIHRPVMRKNGLGSAGSNGTTKSLTRDYYLYLYLYIFICVYMYTYMSYTYVYGI